MRQESIDALQDAIRHLHGAESRYVESVPVTDRFRGEIVWSGIVHVFDLVDHPTATRCYAWSHALDEPSKQRFVAVLNLPPVYSPAAAVRAAIVQEAREGKTDGS